MRITRLNEAFRAQHGGRFHDSPLATAPWALLWLEYSAVRSLRLWGTLDDKVGELSPCAVLTMGLAETLRANTDRIRSLNYEAIALAIGFAVAFEVGRARDLNLADVSSLVNSFIAKRGPFGCNCFLARLRSDNRDFMANRKDSAWMLHLLMHIFCFGLVFLWEFFKESPHM